MAGLGILIKDGFKLKNLVYLLFCFLGLFITQTRGAFLGLIFGFLFLFFSKSFLFS